MRTFRQKIFIGYGASLVLVILILAWAMFMILRLGRASESILRENYRSIQAAEHMIDAIEWQDSAVLLFLLGYREQPSSWTTKKIFAWPCPWPWNKWKSR